MDTKLDKKSHHDCANHYNVYQEVGLPNALRQPRAKRVQDRPKLLLDLLLLVRRAVAVNRSLDLDCLALRAANISPRCHGACPERSRRERSEESTPRPLTIMPRNRKHQIHAQKRHPPCTPRTPLPQSSASG